MKKLKKKSKKNLITFFSLKKERKKPYLGGSFEPALPDKKQTVEIKCGFGEKWTKY